MNIRVIKPLIKQHSVPDQRAIFLISTYKGTNRNTEFFFFFANFFFYMAHFGKQSISLNHTGPKVFITFDPFIKVELPKILSFFH